jgi:hypothetical protein
LGRVTALSAASWRNSTFGAQYGCSVGRPGRVRARRPVHSFASPKERNPEKATRVCRPAARGPHAVGGTETGKRRKLAALVWFFLTTSGKLKGVGVEGHRFASAALQTDCLRVLPPLTFPTSIRNPAADWACPPGPPICASSDSRRFLSGFGTADVATYNGGRSKAQATARQHQRQRPKATAMNNGQ